MHSQDSSIPSSAQATNVHDIAKAQALLHGGETDAFGDTGYQGVEKREERLALPVTWHVVMRLEKRKVLPNTTEGELLEKIGHTKASIRAKVEHPFHVVKNLFCHRKSRYKGLAKIPPSCSRCSVSLI